MQMGPLAAILNLIYLNCINLVFIHVTIIISMWAILKTAARFRYLEVIFDFEILMSFIWF